VALMERVVGIVIKQGGGGPLLCALARSSFSFCGFDHERPANLKEVTIWWH